ncbi:DUF4136 domain-containing protein [Robertkochia sediminum]|uniref:DUF4136 domain-containing protein n=1 Tax=Robertkochia sediminum TaxID=2785326 RepID=UPI001932AEE7|nr:DUF4136 domain-containing protein [Robertkochia sediminum]MBL7472890.1 DUF4136 domain-containing protein [Robertkochia sediminum]
MKAIKHFTPLILLTLFIAGCSSGNVMTEYDRFTDFNDYKTFDFYKPGAKLSAMEDSERTATLEAIENHMASQGYQRGDNPDILVSVFTSAGERSHTHSNANWGREWGWGWGPWWAGNFPPGTPNPAEGTLFIDLIDCKTKTLVWQGIATEDVKSTDKSSGEGDHITRIVQEILGTFPPPHKRSQLAQN